MRDKASALSTFATVLLSVCTVMLTVVAVRREFFPQSAQSAKNQKPLRLSDGDWTSVSAVGHRIGSPTASVTIVEFSDFECPFCARLATGAMANIRQRYPTDVAFVYRHWPLPIHKFAYAAAHAAECAAAQGRFDQFHDNLFAKHDSLGSKPMADFAKESGVADLDRFRECVAKTGKDLAVEADANEAKRLHVPGTPTLVVDGWLLRAGASEERLDSIITDRKSVV